MDELLRLPLSALEEANLMFYLLHAPTSAANDAQASTLSTAAASATATATKPRSALSYLLLLLVSRNRAPDALALHQRMLQHSSAAGVSSSSSAVAPQIITYIESTVPMVAVASAEARCADRLSAFGPIPTGSTASTPMEASSTDSSALWPSFYVRPTATATAAVGTVASSRQVTESARDVRQRDELLSALLDERAMNLLVIEQDQLQHDLQQRSAAVSKAEALLDAAPPPVPAAVTSRLDLSTPLKSLARPPRAQSSSRISGKAEVQGKPCSKSECIASQD